MKTLSNSFAQAFTNIKSNFFRTILSILGIVIGVASLVGILSLIDGMEMFARDQISKTTSLNAINIRHELFNKINDVQVRKDSSAILFYDDVIKLKSEIKQDVTWYLRQASTGLVKLDTLTIGVLANGTFNNIMPDVQILSGKFFEDKKSTNVFIDVVVSEGFINAAHWAKESSIGKNFVFNNVSYQVVGVLKKANENDNGVRFYFSIKNISVDNWKTNPPEIYAFAKHTEQVSAISESIKEWVGKNYPNNKNDFAVITNEFRVAQAAQGFLLFRVIMGLIVGISVLVGGIGVMNVLLISVTERTREIGIRKAVGANKKHIVFQFLSESITISAVGSFIGFVLGVAGTAVVVPIVKAITKVPFQAAYTWNTFIVIAIIAVLVGIVFGTYPALRASRLDPVEAIRHE